MCSCTSKQQTEKPQKTVTAYIYDRGDCIDSIDNVINLTKDYKRNIIKLYRKDMPDAYLSTNTTFIIK